MPRTDYEIRRNARLARMRAYAEKKRAEAAAAREAAQAIAQHIPMGQPVLVGHHSEQRHRKALARMNANYRRSIEAVTEADALEKRIAAAESGAAISADDPHAIERYRAKAAELEASIAAMKAANKLIRADWCDHAVVELLAEQGHAMSLDAVTRAMHPALRPARLLDHQHGRRAAPRTRPHRRARGRGHARTGTPHHHRARAPGRVPRGQPHAPPIPCPRLA